jgi:hypothetical protein
MAATRRSTRLTFTARVEAVSMGVPFYVVAVSKAVSAVLGAGRVHVVGTVNGVPLRTSLNPVAGGGHKLFLNRRIREAAKLEAGDRATVIVERDLAPREEALPDDLVAALREADAFGPFQRMARSMRNEIIRWIDDAKTEPTREKRIVRAVERGLAAREKEIDREAARAQKAARSGG